jgi:hypothetical protein
MDGMAMLGLEEGPGDPTMTSNIFTYFDCGLGKCDLYRMGFAKNIRCDSI